MKNTIIVVVALSVIIVMVVFCLFFFTKEVNAVTDNKNSQKSEAKTPVCALPLKDEELKKILTPEQYRVMRENGTEMPFANEYWNNKQAGIYVDRISGEPLFSSGDKFESGTGWPSFTKPIKKDAIMEEVDTSHGMKRTGVRSKIGNSHLGHVFEDGPTPTGLRYCINSASLRFIPVSDLEKEGYGKYLALFGEIAAFGAGCFWGVESSFREVTGVIDTKVGYMGGTLKNPTYEDVSTHKTGHAEVIQITFDPSKISYEKLLELFWRIHDPTTLNKQGPDVGSQYRSVVFYYSPEQQKAALLLKEKLQNSGKFKKPIVTEVVAAQEFYPAEEYHQRYFEKRGITPSCHIATK